MNSEELIKQALEEVNEEKLRSFKFQLREKIVAIGKYQEAIKLTQKSIVGLQKELSELSYETISATDIFSVKP